MNNGFNIKKIERRLAAAGIAAASFEARELVKSLGESELETAVARRISGEPLQYILGEWEFWGLPFKVGKGVLIPQPDTEILVETALNAVKDVCSPHILDLCAGSGCVAVSLAKERPDADVTAVELYDEAFCYLEKNIALNKTDVKAVRFDVLSKPVGFGKYDLIVSNPPYISFDEMKQLPQEVLAEPHEALFGGADGLEFYRALRLNWLSLLKPDGTFAFEIGYAQAQSVQDIFRDFSSKIIRDYSGNDRVIAGNINN